MGDLKLKKKFCFYNKVRIFYVPLDGTQSLLLEFNQAWQRSSHTDRFLGTMNFKP